MSSRPNILFITTDQHRKDALGAYGNPHLKTPHLDRIAREGILFDKMFVAAPVCGPNRAAIATGRYPSICGSFANGMVLAAGEQTLMMALRDAGYQTFGSGKMHFGPQWRFPPDGKGLVDPPMDWAIDPQPDATELPWYGFDQVALSEDHRVGPYEQYLKEHGLSLDGELHSASYPQSSTNPSPIPVEYHQTTWITERALAFLQERDPGRPFFSWVSYVHPHHPFNPSPEFAGLYNPNDLPDPDIQESEYTLWPDQYKRKRSALGNGHESVGLDRFDVKDWRQIKAAYYGMISQIDAQVGRLLDFLEENDLLENTLIVFTSDHGEMLGDHGLLFKGTFFDCVTNVPCLMRLPRSARGGEVREAFCSSIDLFPTMAQAAGIDRAILPGLQGQSLLDGDDREPIRKYVLIEDDFGRALRTDSHLLVWHGSGDTGELYDLQSDPECFCNRWDDPCMQAWRTRLMGSLMDAMIANRDPLRKKEGPW